MYYPKVDSSKQRIVIENRKGEHIAERNCPAWDTSTSQDENLQHPDNVAAYQAVYDLVKAANMTR